MGGKLTDHQASEFRELLDRLDAVARLASANFPRNSDVRVETCGPGPSAKMVIKSYDLARLIDAGRSILSDKDSGNG